ncbi:MAG: hypothetical protein ACKOSS_06895 [Planctomycetia bacterium]
MSRPTPVLRVPARARGARGLRLLACAGVLALLLAPAATAPARAGPGEEGLPAAGQPAGLAGGVPGLPCEGSTLFPHRGLLQPRAGEGGPWRLVPAGSVLREGRRLEVLRYVRAATGEMAPATGRGWDDLVLLDPWSGEVVAGARAGDVPAPGPLSCGEGR